MMEIKTLAESLRFTVDAPHAALGHVHGCFMTFFAGRSGFSVVPYVSIPLAAKPPSGLLDGVRSLLADDRVEVGADGDVLYLRFDQPIATFPPDDVDRLRSAIERTATLIRSQGILQPSDCTLCGRPGPDGYRYHGGVHLPVHQACLREYLATEEPPSATSHPVVDVQTLLNSVLLATAAGLAAALPAVLAALFVPLLYPFLLALVPLGSMYGYRVGRGVVWRRGIAWILVFDQIVALAVVVWFVHLSARGAGTGWVDYVAGHAIATLIDAAVAVLMTAVGAIVALRILPQRKL